MSNKHMKRCLASFITRDMMQIKIIMRCNSHVLQWITFLKLTWPSVKWVLEELELSYMGRGNAKWYNQSVFLWVKHTLTTYLSYNLPYNPAIPLLGIYPREIKTDVHTYTNPVSTWMCLKALFIIAKIWKQYKCPSTSKWINYSKPIILSNKKEMNHSYMQHG